MNQEIKVIRIKNGNGIDIIAKVSFDGADILLCEPQNLVFYPDASGKGMSGGFEPYIPPYTEEFGSQLPQRFKKEEVLIWEPVVELKNQYNKLFGSGLILGGNQTIKIPSSNLGMTSM